MSDASRGFVARLWLSSRKRLFYCLGSVVVLGIVGPLWNHADSLALATYNATCEIGNRHYIGMGQYDFRSTLILMPAILLARSELMIKALMALSVLTLLIMVRVVFTADTIPTECVSSAGQYHDRASGLAEFDFCFFLIVFISYFAVLMDWSVSGLKRMADGLGATR